MAEYIEGMSKEKFVSITPGEKREYYALSPAQQRLYFLQQVDASSTFYNTTAIEFLDIKIEDIQIEMILKKLLKRHETFRTSFKVVNNVPNQVIHDNKDMDFKIDYSYNFV